MRDIGDLLQRYLDEGFHFTDANLSPGEPILYRGAGGFEASKSAPLTLDEIEHFIASPDLGGENWRQRMRENRNTLEMACTFGQARLRCSVYETGGSAHTLRIAIRRQPLDVPPLETIGAPPNITKMLGRGKGLVLITGPTGAGKTTTMAALLDWINRRIPLHIQTIEQPIEYVHKRDKCVISQSEVPENSPSFAAGVEAALRHRPDIIAIGEILNRETVSAALHAATSGHLVIGTMHTNSCEDTIGAILQFYDGEEAEQRRATLATVLVGIVSQVLIPSYDKKKLHLASEIMFCNDTISRLIQQNKVRQIANAMRDDREYGMSILNDSINMLWASQKISLRAAMRASYDPSGVGV
ncbi:hypothetical protein BI364_07085 [Acidihalobacter yilgarnensis]|uniref:AAA+ ATPase domain-containing protein n=1 Tax=Acidihalobacter yilgarnensis TaxID=2819280 RepID=A0A1D8IMQ8_9GAMM|nr:ATPase, T2SS/T4P/T4SS family [Acidihalobacter yilgarnensis]AOU97756.1 hypothetical protein BI364_07085 [Acidihalobacter yilgarnensis]